MIGVVAGCGRTEVSVDARPARDGGRRVEESTFGKKSPRRRNKLAKVQFASPTRFNHPAGVKKSTILPGMNISLRITLIDFLAGEKREPINPSNPPPPIEHPSP